MQLKKLLKFVSHVQKLLWRLLNIAKIEISDRWSFSAT
jgi:hypothetical protein